jgi:molybdate transport system substrate-binding protein
MNLRTHIRAIELIISLLIASTAATAKDITVFAAASLRGALDDVAALSTDTITLSYAGSGLIARQVAQGAPADVVVLAHPLWMDWLDDRNHLIAGSRTDVAANTLVVIAPNDTSPTDTDIHNWLTAKRIAMGQRDSVPAGIYAKQWLKASGLWDVVQANLIETDNVRLALALVARKDVDAGITYRSDALSDPRVQVVHDIDPTRHTPIRYPAAAITERGRGFVTLLHSPAARVIFHAHGFAPLAQTRAQD